MARLSGLPPGIDMESVLNGNGRAQFDERFALELATVLGIDPSMIQVPGGSSALNER